MQLAKAIVLTGYNHQSRSEFVEDKGFQGQESTLGAESIKTTKALINETIIPLFYFLVVVFSCPRVEQADHRCLRDRERTGAVVPIAATLQCSPESHEGRRQWGWFGW